MSSAFVLTQAEVEAFAALRPASALNPARVPKPRPRGGSDTAALRSMIESNIDSHFDETEREQFRALLRRYLKSNANTASHANDIDDPDHDPDPGTVAGLDGETDAEILLLIVRDQWFAIPQGAVREIVDVSETGEHQMHWLGDAPMLRLREELLTLVRATRLLGLENDASTPNIGPRVIVLSHAGARFGLVVDQVSETRRLAIGHPPFAMRVSGVYQGTAILEDGAIALVLDPQGIIDRCGLNQAGTVTADDPSLQEDGDTGKDRFLLFDDGGPTPKAIELDAVARIDHVTPAEVEYAAGHPVVRHDGAIIPLVSLHETPDTMISGSVPVLLFRTGGREIAVVVKAIRDIVSTSPNLEIAHDAPWLAGSCIINDATTDVIEAKTFIENALPALLDGLSFQDLSKTGQEAALRRHLAV